MMVNLDCDATFSDTGELEVYVYIGNGRWDDASNIFTFTLKDILKENVEMYTVSSNPPYIKHDDIDARDALYTLSKILKTGSEYVEELQNKYLDNEPVNKDNVE
jgi:hypothetical protein